MSKEFIIESFVIFLWKRRLLILTNFVVVVIAASVVAFFIAKKEYKANVTFLPPADEVSNSISLLGIAMPSLTGSSILTDQIETIFNSKAIKRSIIEKFNLYSLFKVNKNPARFELTEKKLKNYVYLESEQKGGMGFEKIISYTITCFHPSPDSARLMGEYTFSLLDSAIRNITINRARRSRIFVEEQLSLNKMKLDSLQQIFEQFQTQNKAFSVPEQAKLSLKTYAEIKSAAVLNEMQLKALQQEFNGTLPKMEELQKNSSLYNQKLTELESNGVPGVMPSLGLSAKIFPQYANLAREIEVQTQVILLLSQEFQHARLQESKDVSSLSIVDPAFTPTYKGRPKRITLLALIVLSENAFLFLLLAYQFYFANVFLKNTRVRDLLSSLKR